MGKHWKPKQHRPDRSQSTNRSFKDLSFWERRCFAVSLWDYLVGERIPLDMPSPIGAPVQRSVSRRWLERMEYYGIISKIPEPASISRGKNRTKGRGRKEKKRWKPRRKRASKRRSPLGVIELPTVQLLRPAEGPHVSLTSGATAFSLVFTHTAIQQADAEHVDRNLATSSAKIINLNNGFPHFIEVLRVATALAEMPHPFTVWYAVDQSRVFLYFVGDQSKLEEVPDELLESLLNIFDLYDSGASPVPDTCEPLIGWIPPETVRQYWNSDFTLPDSSAFVLGAGVPFLPYGDTPSTPAEKLIVNGRPFSLFHAHYVIRGTV